MIASPLFHVGHSLHVVSIGVEMYIVTVVRMLIEFGKRSKSDLHSFHILRTFVLCWIFRFMFLICSYTGMLMKRYGAVLHSFHVQWTFDI